MSDEPKRGWGMATIPKADKGHCDFSRKTPLETFDCINETRMRDWEPKLYPGRVFKTHRRCAFQDDMTQCPDYRKAATEATDD